MFFAALFAIYYTLRATSPELWAERTELLNVPFAAVNTTIMVLSSVTCQLGVLRAERGPVLGQPQSGHSALYAPLQGSSCGSRRQHRCSVCGCALRA